MADDKVYTPTVIPDQPFPEEQGTDSVVTPAIGSGVLSPTTIKERPLPRKVIAHETIGAALNTKSRKILGEFTFTEMGALQVGKYTNGVSGDLRISPNGITARDQSGNNTFSLDGTTGDAVFKGTVTAGSFVSGSKNGVTVGAEAGVNGVDFEDIQEAIDYVNNLGGGKILIKPGTYIVSSDIFVYSNIDLIGEDLGSTIFDFEYNDGMFVVNDKTDIQFTNIHFTKFRGSARSLPSGYSPPGAIYLTHTNASGLSTDRILISNCKFTDNYNSSSYVANPHYSIAGTYASRVIVRDCIFDNTAGIYMGGANMEVSSNRFLNMPKESIYLITTGGEISSNVFDACTDAAVTSADDIESTVISFNRIINHTGVGFSFSGGFDYCILSDNTGEGDVGSTDFILIGSQANNSVISNNCATGFGGDGIDINGGDKLVISGNSLDNNGAYGINIRAGSVSNLVHGNILDTNTSGGISDAGTSTTLADNVTI